MPNLYTCQNCGAKFAKLEKLHCAVCGQYTCPSCSQCYCKYDSKNESKSNFDVSGHYKVEPFANDNQPLFATVEYAKYLINKENLQMKGYLEYTGQRTVYSEKTNKTFLISDFIFYDKTGTVPLRIFGPVPMNYFKYRFGMNKVFLEGVTIRVFKGEFELILNSKGKITLLKDKQSHSLLKYVSNESAGKAQI